MSTNCTIRIKRTDGTQTGIYCHYDGYIEGVGTTLQLAYNTAEKVEKLLALGNLSILGYYTDPNPDEEHSRGGHRQKNVCVAYHRDRGEEFKQWDSESQEYIYTFDDANAVWYVTRPSKNIKTPVQGTLGLEYVDRKVTELLLHEIIVSDVEGAYDNWTSDEFAEEGNVSEACKAKALEAREDILRKEAEKYDSYYRAYCD